MQATFRQSMAWLHTWVGVVLGALLFAIFWMGSLSVFDREIDRWMMPETRFALPEVPPTFEEIARTAAGIVPLDARRWQATLPTAREPVVRLYYETATGEFVLRDLDPTATAGLADAGTWAGTRFIFPFHYRLHLDWAAIGYWLVGLAGMAMLTALTSGVVIHRKVFINFFVFRPGRKLPRSSLDLHNLTGVLVLPFHFVITLSGLIIFFTVYFPTVISPLYQGDRATFAEETYGIYQAAKAGVPGELVSLDAIADKAASLWGGARPYFLRLWYPGDAKSYVEVRPASDRTVTMKGDVAYFDGPSGEVLHVHAPKPVMTAQSFISGLHFIQFEHWGLRWLYFVLGLSGCAMIATGYIYWIETRRKRHAAQGLLGVGVVEGLTVGAVTGIVIATLAFFIANRLLPLGATFLEVERHALEIWVFYLVWLASFAHAWMRPGRAWREQCWIIAGFAVLAVILNAATTGDHLGRSLLLRHLWPVAGMDLMLLAAAAGAGFAALRLHRQTLAQGQARQYEALKVAK